MVLFSLIMALGMLVDNGIVVVENVYRLMEQGMKPLQATREGVGEVALPIIASTATTLAAFLPLAFWPGMMGEFMKFLPITLIVTLASSLFVALVINPVLISVYMRTGKPDINRPKVTKRSLIMAMVGLVFIVAGLTMTPPISVGLIVIGNLLAVFALLTMLNVFALTPMSNWFQSHFLPSLEKRYTKTLNYALHGNKPKWFLGGTVFASLLFDLFARHTYS